MEDKRLRAVRTFDKNPSHIIVIVGIYIIFLNFVLVKKL